MTHPETVAVVTWTWRGLGYCGGADRYKRGFDDAAEAQACMERVLEGRDEATWTVICESGERRRLGSADSGFCCTVVERKAVAA